MKRLTFMFLGVGVALLLAVALLVSRALDSVEEERELRHQAIAERIFDEMERELTELVEREEARPFEQYLHYYYYDASSGSDPGEPLAAVPAEPFIVGYFQIDPTGRVSSPHYDERASPPVAVGEEERREVARRVVAIVSGRSPGRALDDALKQVAIEQEEGALETQSPGTTQNVTSKEKTFESSTYLQSINELNRGAQEREQRVSKLSQVAPANEDLRRGAPGFYAVDVELSTITGRPASDAHLLLVRRASVNGAVFEQGLVIDIERLITWLDETILARSDLRALAEVSSGRNRRLDADELGEGLQQYRRRFAEPFGDVVSVLSLARLGDAPGVGYVYGFSALVAFAVAFGLFGLYRMVGVTVSFAERQRNFVSAVTHELKTPLTAIRMYGEMLRDGLVKTEEKKEEYYEVITSESERLTRLVGNVLELSRLERRHRTLCPVAGAVKPVLGEVANVIGPHARSEGFALRVEVEDGLPDAIFDRDALSQVLFNLVDNALKYAKDFVVLRARRDANGGAATGAVVVSVSDGGPGVRAEHLAHVFEPFFRGESEMTRSSKGTGIGLALVRGLVEEMGGRVEGSNLKAGGFEVRLFLRTT